MIQRRIWMGVAGLSVLSGTLACGLLDGADAELPDFAGGAPYGIDQRPLPASNDVDVVLPPTVGTFQRGDVQGDLANGQSVYATYTSGEHEIFMEAAATGDPVTAQAAIDVAIGEVMGDPAAANYFSMDSDPGYVLIAKGGNVFMAWSHAGYYFSVDPRGSVGALNEFMTSFPY